MTLKIEIPEEGLVKVVSCLGCNNGSILGKKVGKGQVRLYYDGKADVKCSCGQSYNAMYTISPNKEGFRINLINAEDSRSDDSKATFKRFKNKSKRLRSYDFK